MFIVFFSSLIFLNFIIAEVSNSYQECKSNIAALIYMERASLIYETEAIMNEDTKKNNKVKFPKFIVVREGED